MSNWRRCGIVAATATVVLASGTPLASASMPEFGEHPNDRAAAGCANTVNRQFEAEIAAGGGPKEGSFAPANCDHYFGIPGRSF